MLVNATGDLNTFHQLTQATGHRVTFGVHSLEYYRLAYDLFHARGECEAFPLPRWMETPWLVHGFRQGRAGRYFYGASSDLRRETMPAYLLQWEADAWGEGARRSSYDLWGVPDADEQTLDGAIHPALGWIMGGLSF